jgi:hypothetical protein
MFLLLPSLAASGLFLWLLVNTTGWTKNAARVSKVAADAAAAAAYATAAFDAGN